ncbi:uncharacterized protein TM35_000091220 [Trypanosoma theileri]|uniref:Uncharacterized protein n=1 Tax=Trypanosoma theileri TaxID=67003 RepID=A0A1X0NZF9_9TRYP|nr:uncharacterized protein TM35_000091220 [Trypanosoma theileri]ORC90072.1 hypothetical protein TM35_000091220 [Trypanosoma theileri]
MSAYEDSFEDTDTDTNTTADSSHAHSESSLLVRSTEALLPSSSAAVAAPPVPVPVPLPQPVEEVEPAGPTTRTARPPADTTNIDPPFSSSSPPPPPANTTTNPANSAASLTASTSLNQDKHDSSLKDLAIPRRTTTSTDTMPSSLDMQYAGLVAPKGDEFQVLSSYIAFRGSSQGSVRGTSATTDSVIKLTGESGVVAVAEVVEGSAVLQKSSPTPSALDHPVREETEQDTTISRIASSSVFSTLSQHMGKLQARQENINTTGLPKEPMVTTTSELPHDDNDDDRKALVSKTPTVTMNDGITSAVIGSTNITSSPAVVSVSCLPPPPSIPEVPPAPQITFSLPNVAPPMSLTSAVTSSRLPGMENILANVPPPLPSRDPQQDPKIIELRETSEAVERLVRAFALLRGHAVPSTTTGTDSDLLATEKTSFNTKDTEKLSSFRQQHGVGDAGTVRVSQSAAHSLPRRRSPYTELGSINSRSGSKNKKENIQDDDEMDENKQKSLKINEAAVEDAIMCLVMELLQRDAKQPFEERNDRKAIQPSFEVVDMENFRSSTHPHTGKGRKPALDKLVPFSVFEGGMQTFAPDNADAADSLYHNIIDALQKYVWSHVSAPRNQRNYDKTGGGGGGGGNFTPASAFFVWVLLLDLLSVCMQVLENRLAAGVNDTTPVWIQYEGPHEAESLARNAVHCLPFEVLDPSTGENGASAAATTGRRPLFRMEYWVTRNTMWTITEALAASIREGVVSRSDGYRAFRSDGSPSSSGGYGFSSDDMGMLDPAALCPTRIPLFSLVPAERTGGGPREDSSHVRKTFARNDVQNDDGETNTEDYFQIEPQTLELLAHTVSTVSTELLERDIQTTGKKYRQYYQDASRGVAEAVSELLNDAGIRAAVQRRAKAKMVEISERREVSGRATREEKERSMIAAAEEEAERVVEKILQEMRLEEANRR